MNDSRVYSVDQIVPYLYLTGLPGVNESNIRSYSIKLVVNTAAEIPRQDFAGSTTYKIDLDDSTSQSVTGYLDQVADLIHSYVSSSQAVLVHCYMGISRSTTIVIAYLIKYRKMSYKEALKLCISRRSIVAPNSGFIRQLEEYERTHSYGRNSSSNKSNYSDYASTSSSLYSSYYQNNYYTSNQSTDYNRSYNNEDNSRVVPSSSSSSSYYSSYPYSSYYDSYYRDYYKNNPSNSNSYYDNYYYDNYYPSKSSSSNSYPVSSYSSNSYY